MSDKEGGFCDICKHHVLKKDYASHAAKNHSGTQFEKKFYEAISITEVRWLLLTVISYRFNSLVDET